MLTPNHPEDERLSALASAEPEALADADLVRHAQTCTQCSTLVADLGALRISLAQLPDITPSRPLTLLPEVPPAPVDRVGDWARRIFGPVMAAGAAMALVGMVGTAAPSMTQQAGGTAEDRQQLPTDSGAEMAAESLAAPAVGGESLSTDAAGQEGPRSAPTDGDTDAYLPTSTADPERSVWPMVLFSGVALLVAGGLLRWILVPRAG